MALINYNALQLGGRHTSDLNRKKRATVGTWKCRPPHLLLQDIVDTGFVLCSISAKKNFARNAVHRDGNPVCLHLKQIDPSEQKTLANLPWIVEPGQEAKRGINTKYETTIF